MKLAKETAASASPESPPARGRGLKQDRRHRYASVRRSPPARGRGLKLCSPALKTKDPESPPARGRGLKRV